MNNENNKLVPTEPPDDLSGQRDNLTNALENPAPPPTLVDLEALRQALPPRERRTLYGAQLDAIDQTTLRISFTDGIHQERPPREGNDRERMTIDFAKIEPPAPTSQGDFVYRIKEGVFRFKASYTTTDKDRAEWDAWLKEMATRGVWSGYWTHGHDNRQARWGTPYTADPASDPQPPKREALPGLIIEKSDDGGATWHALEKDDNDDER